MVVQTRFFSCRLNISHARAPPIGRPSAPCALEANRPTPANRGRSVGVADILVLIARLRVPPARSPKKEIAAGPFVNLR